MEHAKQKMAEYLVVMNVAEDELQLVKHISTSSFIEYVREQSQLGCSQFELHRPLKHSASSTISLRTCHHSISKPPK